MSIKNKPFWINVLTSIVGIVPVIILAIICINFSRTALVEQVEQQLISVRDIKKNQITEYFAARQGDLEALVKSVAILRQNAFQKLEGIQALQKKQIEDYFTKLEVDLNYLKEDPFVQEAIVEISSVSQNNAVLSDTWEAAVAPFDERLSAIAIDNEWADLMFVDNSGKIIYTVSRDADLGIVIPESDLMETALGQAFDEATRGTGPIFVDFEPYEPINGGYFAFFINPVQSAGRGFVIGYVAFRVSVDKLNEIVRYSQGLGETGESFILGNVDNTPVLRSDQTLGTGEMGDSLSGNLFSEALREQSGTALRTKNDGVLEFVIYAPLAIYGVNWAIMTTIQLEEVIAPKLNDDERDFYAEYVEIYGYQNLYLISPDGSIFYSAIPQADHNTNILTGEYKDSNLSTLVRRVLDSQTFSIADFQSYSPSHGSAAAFIAQPIVEKGQVEVIVALQLPLDAITKIMTQREGMGETGETYLVGADNLMRSNSYLDSENRSVQASFAGDVQNNGVDTMAATQALEGQTDVQAIKNYRGQRVLSAFSPVRVGDFRWALLAEMSQQEAEKAADTLTDLIYRIGMGILVFVIVVVLLVYALVKSLSGVIKNLVNNLANSSEQLAGTSKEISLSSQQLSQGATEQASSLEETSSSMEEISSQTKENALNASSAASAVEDVARKVKQTADDAENASKLSQDVCQSVEKGAETMKTISNAMKDIADSSQQIVKIIEVIKEIAKQTNLLSLNAAIESAKAGDQGKGFAIVAVEVRKLAERSQRAVGDISGLIESSLQKAEIGNNLVKQGELALKDILTKSGKASDLVNSIDTNSVEQAEKIEVVENLVENIKVASREQAAVIEDTARTVADIDTVTKSNALGAEETAKSSQELASQADVLQNLVHEISDHVGLKRFIDFPEM